MFWSCRQITYTPIRVPAVNVSDYYNHKTFPSILLLQAMVDHEHHFMNAYAEWPGSVYDAQILANSARISHVRS